MNEDTTPRGYGISTRHPWRFDESGLRNTSDAAVVALAAGVSAAVWSASPVVGVVAAAACGTAFRSPQLALVAIVLAVGGAARSQGSWAALTPDRLGPFDGWVRLVDDPQPYPSSTRVIVEIEGERFELWSRGRAQQQRVHAWRGGEWVMVSGERRTLDAQRARRVAWQHVVGEFDLAWVSDVDPGGPVARASNRVRATIERAADSLPAPYGSLYRGLVIGDDRDQPREMIDRFRASGLSHLTAVSGQNLTFVLAACGPLLVRLRPLARWATTLGLITWFVALTRFEPSILRAGVMAGLSATAYLTGRERQPVRILALAVLGLVLVDPLLVWSIGFWLSVGATAGVCTLGPWLAARLSALGPLALPLGITLGAQVGVVLPSVLVFGRLPLVSVPANLLAVPVAGFVMLYGLPAGLVAGWIPPLAPLQCWVFGSSPNRRGCGWAGARSPSSWPSWSSERQLNRTSRQRRLSRRAADPIRIEVDMATHLLSGNDESVLRSAVHELVDELVGDGDRAMMVDEFEGDDYEMRSVVDAAQTPAFLTDKRVVVARGVERFAAADLTPLLAYLGDPLPTSDLVLVIGGGSVPKKLGDAVKAVGQVTNTSPPSRPKDRQAWITDHIAAAGLRIKSDAAAQLAAWLGEDAGRLDGIVATLISTYGSDHALTFAEIEPFLGEAGGVPPWDFTDAVDAGNTTKALTLLGRMMHGGGRHPLQIMAILHSHYANIAKLDGVDARSEQDAMAATGITSAFPAKKALANSRRLGPASTRRAIELLAQADLDLRGAKDLEPELVMEVLVARLSKLRR